jgi:hypothetical protein
MGLHDAAPPMRLARPVESGDGRVLLAQGAQLTAAYLERLRGFGVRRLWIRDDRLRDLQPTETYSPKVRGRLAGRFHETAEAIHSDPAALKGILAGGVFDALIAEAVDTVRDVIPTPEDAALEDTLTGHSVRVCLIALAMGRLLRYTPEQLRNLAVGALIHDIGQIPRGKSASESPWELDESEQEHAHLGFEAVIRARHLSATISVVCLQHHERLDGSGWPRRISGSSIHAFARLTSVADRYDTLVHGPQALLEHLARVQIAQDAGIGLDADLVKLFLARIAPYPVGTPLRLSTGEQAVVVAAKYGVLDRPLVRAFGPNAEARDVDLAQEPDTLIEEVSWFAAIHDDKPTA